MNSNILTNTSENLSNCLPTNMSVTNNSYHALKVSSLVCTGLFGLASNVFIIILAVKYVPARSLNHLIINMSIADMCIVLLTFFLELPGYINEKNWLYMEKYAGKNLCKGTGFALCSAMWVPYVILVVMSIERFRATRVMIARPYTKTQRLIRTLLCLIVSLALSAQEYNAGFIKKLNNVYKCIRSRSAMNAFDGVMMVLIIMGYACIFTLSFITLRRLSTGNAIQASLSVSQRKARARKMAGAIKMILCSLLLYSCSYLLYDVIIIVEGIQGDSFRAMCIDWETFDFVISMLPLLNSLLSPAIYLVFMSDYRDAAKRLLYKCGSKSNSVNQNPHGLEMEATGNEK